jgi:hypothetical protein
LLITSGEFGNFSSAAGNLDAVWHRPVMPSDRIVVDWMNNLQKGHYAGGDHCFEAGEWGPHRADLTQPQLAM